MSDDTLAGLLASYQNVPAVFTTTPVPPDAVGPMIVIDGEVAEAPTDSISGEEHRSYNVDIRIYTPALGSNVLLDQILEALRDRLHRAPLTLTNGWRVKRVIATSPVNITADRVRYPALVGVRIDTTRS